LATGKITKRAVEAIAVPAKGKREHLWDETLKGFGAMVTDRGVRSYIVQYRIGGRGAPTRRVTIGKHGSPWTAEKARDQAVSILEQVRRGDDPFDAAKAAIVTARKAKLAAADDQAIAERLGFSVFADRFVEKYAKVHQERSWRETDGIIRRDLKPAFGDKPLTEITDSDIVELLDDLRERGATPALKAYKALRLIFGYATDKERRHLPPARSPMLGMKPPAKVGKRERTLTDEELRLVWVAAGGLGWPFGPIVRLLILTGQRRDEVAGMTWAEVDRDKRSWLLPGARAKNGIANLVPLSDPALAIVSELPDIKSKAKLLFSTTGETAVSGFSKVKARLDASIVDLLRREAIEDGVSEDNVVAEPLAPWTFHDLRRTLATGCERLGFKSEVIEAVINHISGTKAGVAGVYQTYRYEPEKRGALDAWGRHVCAVVERTVLAANVVQLSTRQ
jgi:integrase